MQGGRWKEGGVLKTTWSGGRAFGSGKLAVITREQQETRGLLVAGRGACGWGLRKAILIKFCAKKKKPSLCYVRSFCVVWCIPGVLGRPELNEKCIFFFFQGEGEQLLFKRKGLQVYKMPLNPRNKYVTYSVFNKFLSQAKTVRSLSEMCSRPVYQRPNHELFPPLP